MIRTVNEIDIDRVCYTCGFYDNDYGCTCPHYDMWYACPIQSNKPENIQKLKDYVDFYRKRGE